MEIHKETVDFQSMYEVIQIIRLHHSKKVYSFRSKPGVLLELMSIKNKKQSLVYTNI